MAVTGRWQVELLPGARAGLMEILQDHGDDAFDQALNDILALEDDPTPEDAEHQRPLPHLHLPFTLPCRIPRAFREANRARRAHRAERFSVFERRLRALVDLAKNLPRI